MSESQFPVTGVKTFEFTKIIGISNIEFGSPVLIDDFVLISARPKMKIGNYVHIASFTSIGGGEYFEMGDFSGISQGCRILTGSDDFKDWGFGNPTVPEQYRNVKRAPVVMGRFSIIGANSVVLPGATIGEGASVAAGSVVSRDLEPWGIYYGNRKIGERDKSAVLKTFEKFLQADRR